MKSLMQRWIAVGAGPVFRRAVALRYFQQHCPSLRDTRKIGRVVRVSATVVATPIDSARVRIATRCAR